MQKLVEIWTATISWIVGQRRIFWALLMREMSTRYGRDNIGFLWLLGEPLIFASGVSVLWAHIRPPYENGIKLIPFIVTGYMPLILVRQVVGFTAAAVKNNAALLFHRMVTPLHLFMTRILIEFIGVTLAAVVIITFYNLLGIMGLPTSFKGLAYIYGGWFLLAWVSAGIALVMAALGEIFEFIERFIQVITYVSIPISGAFWMAASMPPNLLAFSLSVPLLSEWEMIRHGYFGPSVVTIFNIPSVVAWGVCLTFVGLLLVQFVRNRVEIE